MALSYALHPPESCIVSPGGKPGWFAAGVLVGEVKAFLFDIDGTLTHSDPVHFAMCAPGQLVCKKGSSCGPTQGG
jgi:hypothetical protein